MWFFFLCFQSVSPLFWFVFCVNIALFESSNQKRLRDKPRFSVGWGECCTVHFKKNKSNFFWNAVVSGIVCFVCWKGTLFLINGEVAFWGNFVLDKKNNETQDGVEVKCSTIIYSYTIEDSYYTFKYCWSVASGSCSTFLMLSTKRKST